MVWIEFLKKHKNALLIGFCVSTCLLSTALIILANVDLWVFMGLVTLLTPTGFSFALLGILLLGTMIGALVWTGLNYLADAIKAWRARRKAALLVPLTEEDKPTAWLDKKSLLSEDHTQDQTIVLIHDNDNQPDTVLSPEDELTTFSKEANHLLAQLSKTISSQEDITALSVCFGTFKKAYYRLAKKYHPDKEIPDKVIWSTQQFQQLNAIYSQVKTSVDRKLESLSQKSLDELLDEENQLLKALIKLFKKHLKWLKRAEEELNAIQVRIDHFNKGVVQIKEGIQRMDEGLARNSQGLTRNVQGSTENAELLKKNAEFADYAEATLEQLKKEQELLVNIAENAFQKDKPTVPPEEKNNKDEKTSLNFF